MEDLRPPKTSSRVKFCYQALLEAWLDIRVWFKCLSKFLGLSLPVSLFYNADIIGLDMGGTSTDISRLENNQFNIQQTT